MPHAEKHTDCMYWNLVFCFAALAILSGCEELVTKTFWIHSRSYPSRPYPAGILSHIKFLRPSIPMRTVSAILRQSCGGKNAEQIQKSCKFHGIRLTRRDRSLLMLRCSSSRLSWVNGWCTQAILITSWLWTTSMLEASICFWHD